jgi:hypothetical protein
VKRPPHNRVLEAIRLAAHQLAGETSEENRRQALARIDESIELLSSAPRHLDANRLLCRLEQLQASLASRGAGERRRIVCERLGISRSRYYELLAELRESVKVRTDK